MLLVEHLLNYRVHSNAGNAATDMKLYVADAINRETAMMAIKSWYGSTARMHSRLREFRLGYFTLYIEIPEIEINNLIPSHCVYARARTRACVCM